MANPTPNIVERVHVEGSTEQYSEFRLSDGTLLRGKIYPTQIQRLDIHDGFGMPVYNIPQSAVVWDVVECREDLKASKQ